MKHLNKVLLAVILIGLVVLAFPGRAYADTTGRLDDKVVFGGTYTLDSGDTLDGNLAVIGGTANIEEDARVDGDVFLTGGSLNLDGRVDGNVVTFGGSIFLGETAVIQGDITTFGGVVHRSDGSEVEGEIIRGSEAPFNFNVPNNVFRPDLRLGLDPLWKLSAFLARTLALAALAVLIVLAAPNATNRVAQTAFSQPILAGGAGLLTIILGPIVLIILLITILLIPVSLIGIVVLAAAAVFGYIAIGLEIGRRLETSLKGSWSWPLAAGIGTFVVGLVVGLIGFIPCIGWMLEAAVGLVGLGAVLLTRFGTQPYTGTPAAPIAPVPPVMPVAAYAAPVAPVSSVVDVYPVPEEPSAPQTPEEKPSESPDQG